MEKFRKPISSKVEQQVPEKIRSAAIMYNGEIFEAPSHGLATLALLDHIKITDPALYDQVHGDECELIEYLESINNDLSFEGFMTSENRYVPRQEATEIAHAAEQLEVNALDRELRSEDMK